MATPSQAVFLSYASQDAEAAKHICDSLRAAAIEVWFDQNELRGGDAWDASIRRQIKECALFVPIISANSNARSEGYFRLEWRLAVERSQLMADDQAFLLPVVIDDTSEATARVPDRFRERQWSRLPNGATPSAFVERVAKLLYPDAPPAPVRAAPPTMRAVQPARRRWLLPVVVVAILAAASTVLLTGHWGHKSDRITPQAGKETVKPSDERKSIAVMPFANLSGRSEDAYLADGLQEEILNALARLPQLNVISRTSVMELRDKVHDVRDIGQRLNVQFVLEGSIRRDANRIRLTVQLINASNDLHVMATNYDRDLGHVIDLQSTVAKQVATALTATLTHQETGELERVGTNNGDAYDHYLQALSAFREIDDNSGSVLYPKAIKLLEEAVQLDPEYADALALLSEAETNAFQMDGKVEDADKARVALFKALDANPGLPEVKLARGLYALYVTQDTERALPDLKEAVQLRPNSSRAHLALGFVLRRRGLPAEAYEHFMRSWDLDPLNRICAIPPLYTMLGLRRYPEALTLTDLYVKRLPDNIDGHYLRVEIEAFSQHSGEPIRQFLKTYPHGLNPVFKRSVELALAATEHRYRDALKLASGLPQGDPLANTLRDAFFHFAAGDAGAAEQAFRSAERLAQKAVQLSPEETGALSSLALAESMLGEHAVALANIDKARAVSPESRDAVNGPRLSFLRSIILVRAGRSAEGYAEVTRLLRVPFGAPQPLEFGPELLAVEHDPHYDELIYHAPRL